MPEITWKKFEKDIHNPDNEKAIKATDAFIDERNLQMRTSKSAREWEKDRKKEIALQKPEWKKELLEKELEPQRKADQRLKKAGQFEYGLIPSPGYLIVEPDFKEQTETGIYLADTVVSDNVGRVLEVGKKLFCKHCFISLESQPTEAPANKGDKVLFKRGAGIDVELKDKKCKFMMFSDILGIFIE